MKIAVVGLGYVGLPLAVAFSRKFDVVGFDISPARIAALRRGVDSNAQVAAGDLAPGRIRFSGDPADLSGRDVFVVTVPTPIDQARRPDLSALLDACETVGRALAPGAVVVFESTVYPGLTEDICGPALSGASGLAAGSDFKLGYSPERINPGDEDHPIEKIVKVVAGQDPETLDRLAGLYGSIIEAGVHRAPSIKVAEAAKVLENTQRDLNIALMNELSKICDLLDIRTRDVLAAAATKWNFLRFHPGLVGGHCIGVDPYYLTAKAEQLGYHPEVILSGRKLNDGMACHVAQRALKLLAGAGHPITGARVGILGFTFKENVPDTRNTKVIDLYRELRRFGVEPLVHDPVADREALRTGFGVTLSPLSAFTDLHALILAVPHRAYCELDGSEIASMIGRDGILVDLPAKLVPGGLRADVRYWSL